MTNKMTQEEYDSFFEEVILMRKAEGHIPIYNFDVFLEEAMLIKNIEKEREEVSNQSLLRYTYQELKEIFGVSEQWANKRKIAFLKQKRQKIQNNKDRLNNIITFKAEDEFEKSLLLDLLEEYNTNFIRLEKEIRCRSKPEEERSKSIDIEQLKNNNTIASVLGISEPHRDQQMIKCPLHNDKTPSFCIYKKTNTWYCFGCGEGSDVIALYMRIHDCDFVTAINQLN